MARPARARWAPWGAACLSPWRCAASGGAGGLACPPILPAPPPSTQTHTMSGTDIGEYANRGINYRALDDLFELNRQRALEVGCCGEPVSSWRSCCRQDGHASWPAKPGPCRPSAHPPAPIPITVGARWSTASRCSCWRSTTRPSVTCWCAPQRACARFRAEEGCWRSCGCCGSHLQAASSSLLCLLSHQQEPQALTCCACCYREQVPEAEAKQQRPLALKNLERSGLNVPDAIQVGRR